MGGIGSDRYLRWAGRITIDQCPRVSIEDIPKEKLLHWELFRLLTGHLAFNLKVGCLFMAMMNSLL
jgi:hypothetical protein